MFIHWQVIKQTGIGVAYLHTFLMTMLEIDTATEVYLETFQTHMVELYFPSLTDMDLNTACSYRNIIWYYNKDETRAFLSSEIQVKH